MNLSGSRAGVVLLLLLGCQALSSCENGRPLASPLSPPPSLPVTPIAQQPRQGGTFSMSIVSIDKPFDCVLKDLSATGAAPQNLRVTIDRTQSLLESHHFGTTDTWGSVSKSDSHYEFTAPATTFRWYGMPPSPVRNGLCPQEWAEYVITYARVPIELIASTAAGTRDRVDLVITATKNSDTAGWVPFGETRVVAEAVRMR